MLSKIFCDDICDVIRKMLQVDFTLYKLWCFDECDWIYCWTENIKPLRCPTKNNHHIYKNIVMKTTHINANNKILKIIPTNKNIQETTFEIIDI